MSSGKDSFLTTTSARIAFQQFVAWWTSCLAESLPGFFGNGRSAVSVENIARQVSGSERLEYPDRLAAGSEVSICLEAGSVLVHERRYDFELLAAIPDLLKAEINRLTPYEEYDVSIAHDITGYDWDAKKLTVSFCVVRSDLLARLYRNAEEAGYRPVFAFAETADYLRFPALSPENAGRSTGADRGASVGRWVWAVTAAVVFLAVLLVPAFKMKDVSGDMVERLETARSEANQGAALLTRAKSVRQTVQLLQQHRNDYQPRLEILTELSSILPAESWLVGLDIQTDKVRLSGYAATPSDVVTALTGSGWFADIQYRSAGARAANQNAERFELTATLVSPGDGS